MDPVLQMCRITVAVDSLWLMAVARVVQDRGLCFSLSSNDTVCTLLVQSASTCCYVKLSGTSC